MNELVLRDIHLPDASLWWPPGPGWWLLLLLLLVSILIIPWLLKRLRRKPIKSVSLREIDRIRLAIKQGQSDRAVLQDLSSLIRRVVISYHGRKGYAGSTGDHWLSQLEQFSSATGFSPQQLRLLGRDRYRRDYDVDIDSLLQSCESWIKSLPRSYVDVPG